MATTTKQEARGSGEVSYAPLPLSSDHVSSQLSTRLSATVTRTVAAALGFRSITGYAFSLADGAISWQSKRQKSIALSTVEAEYMVTTEAVKKVIWWRPSTLA